MYNPQIAYQHECFYIRALEKEDRLYTTLVHAGRKSSPSVQCKINMKVGNI